MCRSRALMGMLVRAPYLVIGVAEQRIGEVRYWGSTGELVVTGPHQSETRPSAYRARPAQMSAGPTSANTGSCGCRCAIRGPLQPGRVAFGPRVGLTSPPQVRRELRS